MLLPELSTIDTRKVNKNITTKFIKLTTRLKKAVNIFSVVKTLPAFSTNFSGFKEHLQCVFGEILYIYLLMDKTSIYISSKAGVIV